ncbi:DUF7848 domain-containing protein [Streptomyces abikoensis]
MTKWSTKFADWSLVPDPEELQALHRAECLACGMASEAVEVVDSAETWSLHHAILTEHTRFLQTMTYHSEAVREHGGS